MKTDYVLEQQHLEARLAQLGQELPGPMSGFARLHRKAVEEGALPGKVKEMMALAISTVVGCDGCSAYHVHDAVAAGAHPPGTSGNHWRCPAHGRWTRLHFCCPCTGCHRAVPPGDGGCRVVRYQS